MNSYQRVCVFMTFSHLRLLLIIQCEAVQEESCLTLTEVKR